MCVLESLNLENVRKYEHILEKSNNEQQDKYIFDIKQFFKNIPNNAHEGLYDYTEEETTETEAELYDPLTRLAKDIELGNLANIQSDDNFSDTDSDNDLEEILDMEIDDTDCMTIENNTNSFMV